MFMFVFKDFPKIESYFFLYFWNSGRATFKEQPNKKSNIYENKLKDLAQIKRRFSS